MTLLVSHLVRPDARQNNILGASNCFCWAENHQEEDQRHANQRQQYRACQISDLENDSKYSKFGDQATFSN